MSSDVDISNLALDCVGAKAITDLDQTTKPAERCKRYLPLAREASLKAGDWSFASKRVASVAADAMPPDFGFLLRYAVPSDCLAVREVRDASGNTVERWKQETGHVLCDTPSPIAIRYTFINEDASTYPPDFVEAVAYRLGAFLAIVLTENRELKKDLLTLWKDAVNKAMTDDGRLQAQLMQPDPKVLADPNDSKGLSTYVPDSIRAR